MSLNAGDIVFNITGDSTQLTDALGNVKNSFSGATMAIGTAMTAAGAAITGMATAAVYDLLETSGALVDMSARTGIGVEKLQELGYSASLSGGSLEDLEKATKKMSQTIFAAGEEAAGAGTKQADAFEKGSKAVGNYENIYMDAIKRRDELQARVQAGDLSRRDDLQKAQSKAQTALENYNSALEKHNKKVQEASQGGGSYTESLRAIGLTYDQLKNMKPEDQFMTIGFALAGVGDQSTRTALAMQLFGKSGTALLPMLAEGKEGFKANADEAHRLGLIIGGKTVMSAEQLGDEIGKLGLALRGVGYQIAEALLPDLKALVENIKDVAMAFVAWRNENPDLFDSIAKIVVVVGAVMAVIGPLLVMLPGLVAAFSAVKTAVIAVGAVFAALGVAVAAPAEIVILAIANIIAWGYLLVTNWEKVKDFMIEIWKVMANAFELIMSPIMWAWEKMKGVSLDSANAAWGANHPKTNADNSFARNDMAQGRGFGGMAMAGAGGGGAAITMNFNISGATDPGSISRAIAEQLRLELRARGI